MTTLTVRRLPATRHSFTTYFVVVNDERKAELPPAGDVSEAKIELSPGRHVLRITTNSLGAEISVSNDMEVVADERPIVIETTAYLRGLMFWAEPIVALLPWLWLRSEVRLTRVSE